MRRKGTQRLPIFKFEVLGPKCQKIISLKQPKNLQLFLKLKHILQNELNFFLNLHLSARHFHQKEWWEGKSTKAEGKNGTENKGKRKRPQNGAAATQEGYEENKKICTLAKNSKLV